MKSPVDVLRSLPARPQAGAAALGLVLAAWLVYLYRNVPSVSRGDFFLAMVRFARSVEQGEWLYVLTWPVHILGGHIVFYERVLQLTNYYLFDYSPHFVKYVAMVAWVLLGIGILRFVVRLPLPQPSRLAALLLLALVTFNPIPWASIVWADSTIPYLSALIALLFVSRHLVAAVEGEWTGRAFAGALLCCVLVIFGSGVGWSILPAMGWLIALRMAREGRLRKFLLLAAVLAAAVAVAVWIGVTFFPRTLRMGLVRESLASLPDNLEHVAAYFVSLFATFFAVSERPWNLWLGGGLFGVSLATYFFYRRRTGTATEPELLYVFGVLSLVLVSLGRWKLAADRGWSSPVTYYHLFALPVFYGFVTMALRLLPERARPRLAWGGLAALATAYAVSMGPYHLGMRGTYNDFTQMIRPLQGWRMTDGTRFIGEPELNHELFSEFLPLLKRDGKYVELSGPFHPYRSSRMAPPQPTENRRSCSSGYRNLDLMHTSPDRRRVYGAAAHLPDYRRFVGTARNALDCDQQDVAVSLVATDGTVLCKSWTTPNVYWYFEDKAHLDITRSPFAFDFTCPVEAGAGYFLVSQDPQGKLLETLRVLP